MPHHTFLLLSHIPVTHHTSLSTHAAVSAGGRYIGSQEGQLIVRRTLSLTPSLPRDVRSGDVFLVRLWLRVIACMWCACMGAWCVCLHGCLATCLYTQLNTCAVCGSCILASTVPKSMNAMPPETFSGQSATCHKHVLLQLLHFVVMAHSLFSLHIPPPPSQPRTDDKMPGSACRL